MGRITLVTGGARRGKSRFAETLAAHGRNVCYVATAEALDMELKAPAARQISATRCGGRSSPCGMAFGTDGSMAGVIPSY